MRRRHASTGLGVILLGIALALTPAAMASASKHATTMAKHHKKKTKKKGTKSTTTTSGSTAKSSGTVKVGPLTCPNQAFITAAAGATWKGPAKTNGGTAACIYTDSTGTELNVILDSPSEPLSKFIATDPGAIGEPATRVSGIGAAAFETTTYGHAEVDVYQSTSKGFAVTLDPATAGTVTTTDLTVVEAVAKAYASR